MAAAHVPEGTIFATKRGLAVKMIARAIAAYVPFVWVAADSVYGVGDIEMALRCASKSYVLGVNANHHFGSWLGKPPVAGTAEEIAHDIDPSLWRRLSAGDGTKGARLYDWLYCGLADLDAAEYDDERAGLWTRGLLVRRNIADSDLAFFSTWCPAGTSIETLVKVEGSMRPLDSVDHGACRLTGTITYSSVTLTETLSNLTATPSKDTVVGVGTNGTGFLSLTFINTK
jgi:SRSO17 transposase